MGLKSLGEVECTPRCRFSKDSGRAWGEASVQLCPVPAGKPGK